MKRMNKNILPNFFLMLVLLISITSCIDTEDINNPKEKTIDNLVVADSFKWTTSKSVVLILNAISENPEFNSKVSIYDGNPNQDGKLLLNCGVTESTAFEGELQVLASKEKLFIECEFPNGTFALDSVFIEENNTIQYTFNEVQMTSQSALAIAEGPDCSEGCDETITALNGNLTVSGGSTYCVTSDFSGNITFQGAGGVLRICGTTTLYNVNINGNASVSIVVSESGTLTAKNLNLNGDASLTNWGILNYKNNFSLSGTLKNYGTANIDYGLNINWGGELLNEGQLNISENFNSSSEVINNGSFIVSGHFNNNGGSSLLNNCKIVVTGNFYQNAVFNNYGYLYTGGAFTINGGSTTNLYNQAMLNIKSFMLNDNIHGTGDYSSISVDGNTTINGSGSITGTIDICDENGIETNTGSIAESVTYCENYIPVSDCNPVGIGEEPLNDADGDGVTDSQDEFPNDPSMAYRSYLAGENTSATLLFEDLWPAKGDYDFNDLVAGIEGVYYTNSANKVVQLTLSIDVKAVGASNQNGLGLQFDAIVPNGISSVTGNVKSNDSQIIENSNSTEANQEAAVVILIENVNEVINRVGGATFNTLNDGNIGTSDLVEVEISFANNPVAMEEVSAGKLNFFLIKNQNRATEIHLADFKPSTLMTHEFGDNADTSSPENNRYYKTENNLPWGIFILDEVMHPIEKTPVTDAYSSFYDWAVSSGASNTEWYNHPNMLSVWQAE